MHEFIVSFLSFVCIIDYKEKRFLFMNLYSSFRCITMWTKTENMKVGS